MKEALAVVLLMTAARVAPGDESALVADRPGFGESASAVLPRHVQAETGVAWTRVDSGTSVTDAPEALVRIGLCKPLELRLLVPDWLRMRAGGHTTTGWADMAIGLKGHLAAGGSDLALRGTLYLPTGAAAFSAGRVEPEIALAWSRALSERWSLGATIDVRRLRLAHETSSSPSLSLGRSLGRRLGTFLEYGANLARGARALHKLDHGYTWVLDARTQLDASLGVALSPAAPDFFLGAGFCHRF